jgi:uncharacterized tellurite resistance protein B-like protein
MTQSSGPPNIPSGAFASELVKLLVQVAWADHDVVPAEADVLVAFARRCGLTDAELTALQDSLAGRAPLAPPNLGLLKTRRTEVLRAVKQLLLSDLEVAEEEEEILSQIAALLGGS